MNFTHEKTSRKLRIQSYGQKIFKPFSLFYVLLDGLATFKRKNANTTDQEIETDQLGRG